MIANNFLNKTVWPSGLRRRLKAPVHNGVGSNPTAVSIAHYHHGVQRQHATSFFASLLWNTTAAIRIANLVTTTRAQPIHTKMSHAAVGLHGDDVQC